jgi:putative transposase
MARLWRNRWLELSVQDIPVVERLADAPRPGGPMTFSLEQILQLFAIAGEKPEDYGRPTLVILAHKRAISAMFSI